jgi:GntR family transcriptional regulator of arabinose operon
MAADRHKYEILMDYLKEQISSGAFQSGEKIPSENVLAESFGLSRFTVRRAIELLTNEGLLEKRHGSGTFVRSQTSQKARTRVIGVVTTYLDDYIFPGIISGIDEILTNSGYTISLGITSNKTEKEAGCLASMLAQNVDGLIIEGTKSALPSPNLEILHTFRSEGIPIVFINGRYANFDSSYVLMDDEKAGSAAACFLIQNGHHYIGGIFKSDDIQGHLRYKGFVNACHAHGIAINEDAILWFTTEDLEGIFSSDYDRLFLKRFEKCSAILCYNDQIALKTAATFERNAKAVPADMSIVGFDNSNLCEITPLKLTSVSHAHKKMGIEAASAMLSILSTGKPVKKKLAPELMVRNSVADIR